MPSGFFVSVKTNAPAAYLAGIVLFLVLGILLAVLAFASVVPGGTGTGVAGIVVAAGAALLLVEFLVTR